MIITIAPSAIAIAVPATPEFGKNFLPGFTKEPQPIIHPNANAHTCVGDNCFCSVFFPLFFNIYSPLNLNLTQVLKSLQIAYNITSEKCSSVFQSTKPWFAQKFRAEYYFLHPVFSLIFSANPTGMVDLITITASELHLTTL